MAVFNQHSQSASEDLMKCSKMPDDFALTPQRLTLGLMVVERNGELQNDPWAYPVPLSESTLPPFIAAILAETLLYGQQQDAPDEGVPEVLATCDEQLDRRYSPPGIPLVIGTAFGYISMGTKSTGLKIYIPVYILIVLVLNNALTLLTAGRVWWISRQVRSSLEKERQRDYTAAAAIIIESGAIYSASTILILAVCKNPRLLVIAACISIRTVVGILPPVVIDDSDDCDSSASCPSSSRSKWCLGALRENWKQYSPT
ncbi:uncharacterized protein LACBIDRAFT_325860 [Laccaria bicolor S238N-H82]|uniref:Predicted protein n=1 Tax=Laccaria bicolor (strain S238N-H82 / ATCC MYA-4686) TaxID=486041 RepID=B0D6G9_LACBS|nr:uncharacterized protein LACBIDRAFT_325860 [Laccaria bicolor S238N-H82]EDR09952.1 predicted protein [Laccaria bicolor S238N-H82]|eukprot:XP_001879337.1 predicted protein [Laccaria bicolor S238N-H82]